MNIKKRKMKRKKTSTRKSKVTKFQIKTFMFETVTKTKKPEEVDNPVNEFLKTADVKDKESIIIDQGDGYIRVSIIYKVKVDKV